MSSSRALSPPTGSRLLRAPIAVALLAPLVWWNAFAGDAEIHLVYARNLAHGQPFEFNAGETSAGVTSPGWMLLLSLLFRAMPESAVIIALKVLCYAAWYGVLALAWQLGRTLVATRDAGALALAATGLIAGSVFNALVGMEAGFFALVVLAFLAVAIRWRWFEERTPRSTEVLVVALLSAACWLRPEGFVVALLAVAIRALRVREWAGFFSMLGVLLGGGGLLAFHHAYTGLWLPASGLARRMAAMSVAWHVGPVLVDPHVLSRLLAYAPLTALALIGTRSRPRRPAWLFVATVAWVFIGLYTFVLGAAHLARYLVFVMPLLALLAVRGVETVRASRHFRWLALGGAAWMLVVFAVETVARMGALRSDSVALALAETSHVRERSDALLARLGAPVERPVTVALGEVHLRRTVDERFVVRPLDGRTDALWLNFVDDGTWDPIGYLRARQVRFLLDLPFFSPALTDALARLRPGESFSQSGMTFTRLPAPQLFRIDDRPSR